MRRRTSTTKHQALYGSQAWRRASERFRASPEGALCRWCLERGLVVPAAAVDHIVPHGGDPLLFWSETNWQGICNSCHAEKSRLDEIEAKTGRRPKPKGCDAQGNPIGGWGG